MTACGCPAAPSMISRWKRRAVGLLRASVSAPEVPGATYTVVVLAGEVDATNSDELYGVLESVVAQQPRLLIVDMSELSFMDSTGLRMLLRSTRALDQQGGVLALAAPQLAVARGLQLTRADQLIPVYDSVAEATAASRAPVGPRRRGRAGAGGRARAGCTGNSGPR